MGKGSICYCVESIWEKQLKRRNTMSNWHKQVSKNLSDAVSNVLKDYADQKAMQNGKLKGKGKGEPVKKVAQELPEDDDEETLDPVNPKANKKKFANRKDKDIDNDGDVDGSDKFLHKKRKAISKAIRKTSAKSKKIESKKIKLSGKKEKVTVNPPVTESFIDERSRLREALEASFDTVFQYGNKEEEAFREQWMNEFSSHVSGKDPHAYIDPLQSKVLYIEGLTPRQAASRYLSACIANAAMAGGEYKEYGTRGGDPVSSSQLQGQEVGKVYQSRHQVKH
jgi:hypothetical protein